MTSPTVEDATDDLVAAGRAEIDALDAQLVALLQQRAEVSRRIQAARMSTGRGRIAHSRELAIVKRYSDGLGRSGAAVALSILEVCRGKG